MDCLTLRPLDGGGWAWVLQSGAGLQSGTGELGAMPRRPDGARVRLMLPGAWVTHLHVTISAKSARLIAQALPFAVEESLAEDIEDVRLAHGQRSEDGLVAVRAVNRARLQALLDALKAHGLEPDAIFSELDAIPTPTEGWVLLPLPNYGSGDTPEGGQVLARSKDEAMSVDMAWLKDLLAGGEAVHVVHAPGADALIALLAPEAVRSREPAPQGAWVWLHQHLRETSGIDFLAGQGRGKPWGETLRPWVWPAALAASVLVAQLGLMLWQTQEYKRQTLQMQDELARVAREAAPQVQRWVNPLVQLRQMAKGTGATANDAALLPLLAAASPAFAAQPTVRLGQLRYQAAAQPGRAPTGKTSGAQLEMQLQAQDAAALEALAAALKSRAGAQVELHGLRVEGGQAEARLRFKEGGA
ncbi:MAG: type II secretion system protein GspL [Pseudomonadota bacterium]